MVFRHKKSGKLKSCQQINNDDDSNDNSDNDDK